MRSKLMLLACLASVGAGTVLIAQPVLAQGTAFFSDAGHFQLLEPAAIVADGATKVELRVVMLEPDGRPMSGFKGKISSTSGTTGDLQDKGNGIYAFAFTPAQDSTGGEVTFTLKGKTSGKANVEKAWTIPVQPSLAVAVSVSANPQEMVLGQDEGASLSIKLTGPGGSTVGDGTRLSVRAASGGVEALTPLGGGVFTARYVPKKVNYPHLDIITMTDARDPSKVYGVYVVKLTGKTDFPVTTQPNASVLMRIGDREFGPYATDSQGKAKVPIVVSPGSGQATIVTIKDGKTTEEPLDLQVPETKRVALFPIGGTVAADPTQPVVVRIAVRTATGEPDIYSRLTVSSTAGQVGEATHEGEGIYRATWTPPTQASGGTATIKVSVNGAPGVQTDEMEVAYAPARPTSVTITPEPAQLTESAGGFKVYAKVVGGAGGMTGNAPALLVSGATQRGETKDLKGGDYEASFATTGNESVRITAIATGAVSENPLARVVLIPSETRLANDGRSVVVLTVLSVDRFGYPVPNKTVNLKVTSGDAKIKKEVTTDDHGAASVYLSAGSQVGVVNVRGTSGDVIGATAVLQGPAALAPGFDLPTTNAFSNQVKSVVVEREGATTVAANPDDMSGDAGPLARLEATASPTQVVPGGKATITIVAKDADGRGVAGETLNVLTNGGKSSGLQDKGGGTYTLELTVPEGATDNAMVVVTNNDGTITQAVSVAVNAPTWGGATTTVASTTTSSNDGMTTLASTENAGGEGGMTTLATTDSGTEPVVTEPVVTEPVVTEPTAIATTTTSTTEVPKPPRDSSGFPFARVRVGVGGGTYSYAQQRTDGVESVLWEENVYLGGEQGTGAPANPLALDVRATAWAPGMDYLGVDLSFRMASYSIVWPGTDASIPDLVPQASLNLAARYPFVAGANQFHVGVKAGYLYGDFISYQKGGNAAQLDYTSLPVSSLGTGAEIGAEFGQGTMRGYLNAGVLAGWRGTALYSRGIAFDLGMRPTAKLPVGLAASFQVTNRDVDMVAQDDPEKVLGTVSDTQVLFMAGPTLEF